MKSFQPRVEGTPPDDVSGTESKYWESGYCEIFYGRMRDKLLNGEIFYSLGEAQIIIKRWSNHYDTKRPHRALVYRPTAPKAILQMD